jgi:hypothetical protein
VLAEAAGSRIACLQEAFPSQGETYFSLLISSVESGIYNLKKLKWKLLQVKFIITYQLFLYCNEIFSLHGTPGFCRTAFGKHNLHSPHIRDSHGS